ncbi:hypothetical protein MAM1_0122c05891 [Mucor ambiguus]|uniref:Uncharacterized protein n=1 Tax=Mucor ambiguus TaxID=91626 RepID=A0A0C9MGI7_9FUNG|nr:hypothetical protein MAM1_0122c05891 [Mucor ambiguus]
MILGTILKGDVESDTIQYGGGNEGSLIKDETIVSLPNIRHRNDDYMLGGDARPLTISNVVKVEGEERMANSINGYRWPEELRDNTLPNCCLKWTFKKEVVNRTVN